MTPRKIKQAFAIAKIPNMPSVRAHILRDIGHADQGVLDTMTSKQLSAVITAAHRSYHDGRASCDASIEDDCVWIGAGVDRLVPLSTIRALPVDE